MMIRPHFSNLVSVYMHVTGERKSAAAIAVRSEQTAAAASPVDSIAHALTHCSVPLFSLLVLQLGVSALEDNLQCVSDFLFQHIDTPDIEVSE